MDDSVMLEDRMLAYYRTAEGQDDLTAGIVAAIADRLGVAPERVPASVSDWARVRAAIAVRR